MMHGAPALAIRIPFEHREVDHPQWLPARLEQAEIVTKLQTQRADRIVDDLGRARVEENHIAVDDAGPRQHADDGLIAEKLDNLPMQPVAALRLLARLDVRDSLRVVSRD